MASSPAPQRGLVVPPLLSPPPDQDSKGSRRKPAGNWMACFTCWGASGPATSMEAQRSAELRLPCDRRPSSGLPVGVYGPLPPEGPDWSLNSPATQKREGFLPSVDSVAEVVAQEYQHQHANSTADLAAAAATSQEALVQQPAAVRPPPATREPKALQPPPPAPSTELTGGEPKLPGAPLETQMPLPPPIRFPSLEPPGLAKPQVEADHPQPGLPGPPPAAAAGPVTTKLSVLHPSPARKPQLEFAEPDTVFVPVPEHSGFDGAWDKIPSRSTASPHPIDLLLGASWLVRKAHDAVMRAEITEDATSLKMRAVVRMAGVPIIYDEFFSKDGQPQTWLMRRDLRIPGRTTGEIFATQDGRLVMRTVAYSGMSGGKPDHVVEDYLHLEDSGNTLVVKMCCLDYHTGGRAVQVFVSKRTVQRRLSFVRTLSRRLSVGAHSAAVMMSSGVQRVASKVSTGAHHVAKRLTMDGLTR